MDLLVNKRDLLALYLSGTYCHKTNTRPPSCQLLENLPCVLLTGSTITLLTFTFFSSNPPEREFNSQTAEVYQKAKEQLTNDSRQFVTASKLFVKSATENEQQLLECLGHCVHLIDRIGSVTYDVALYTPTPQQTLGLLVSHFLNMSNLNRVGI